MRTMSKPVRRGFLVLALLSGMAGVHAQEPGFNANHAMMRVFQEMSGNPNYWVFMLDVRERLSEDLDMLIKRLPTAAAANESICISGPDPSVNRNTLEKALAKVRGRDLDGLTLVYLGPQADREAMTELVAPYHAEMRYVVYPEEGAPGT